MAGEKAFAYIGVGSNISPKTHIGRALTELARFVSVCATSTFYRTKPTKGDTQKNYLNGVWKISTSHKPRHLKFFILQRIETRLGRVRTANKYASRTIDLDLLLYDNQLIREPGLHIPDPDIYTRPFISIPLHELAPTLVLPDTLIPIRDIINKFDKKHLFPELEFTEQLKNRIHQNAAE